MTIRWTTWPCLLGSLSMSMGSVFAAPAFAQNANPPPPPGAPAPTPPPSGTPTADPPARVGWLSQITGSVSFHSAGQDQWTIATQNYPVTSGDAVWTQPQAAASVMIDSSRIALAGGTEFTMQEIDQSAISAVLSQGEIFLNLVSLQPGQTVTVTTPRGTAQIGGNGEYEIYAGDSTTPTYVTAVTGSIQFTGLGSNAPQSIGAQQTVVASGTNPVQLQAGAMQQDQFLTSMLGQVAPPPPPTMAQAPAACGGMTGAAVLSSYGTWKPQPQYGTVWFPRVASGWVPYREGHWAYVAPWGYTWIADEPWGFAPFHYGRWAQFDGQWGWVPQPVAEPGYIAPQPVYAPALVTFLGAAAGAVAIGALASGSIGWAPLGPRDPYYPPYAVSPHYFERYNRPYVANYNQFYQRNVTVVNNRVDYRNVVYNEGHGGPGWNGHGTTFMAAGAMAAGHGVRQAMQPPPQGGLRPFEPGMQHMPRPMPGQMPGGAMRPAPGPAIRPMAGGMPGRGMPGLVQHAQVAPQFRGGMQPGGGQPGGQPGGIGHGPQQMGAPRLPPGGGEAPRPQFHAMPGAAPGMPNAHGAPGQPGMPPMRAEPRLNGAPQNGRQEQPGGMAQHGPGMPQTPRGEAPRMQAPRGEAPRAQAPGMQGPRMQAPRAEAPRMQAPRMQAPRMQAPRAEAPRMQAPRMQAPRMEAPRMQAPRMQAPRMEAPRMQAPRMQAPRMEAPRQGGGGGGGGHERPPQGHR